ncbi:MAG TPA: hypothetical protein PLA80_06440 [Synergistaceae bacterium]|nr:hypothetical protein [Synergistaceae bacterium]
MKALKAPDRFQERKQGVAKKASDGVQNKEPEIAKKTPDGVRNKEQGAAKKAPGFDPFGEAGRGFPKAQPELQQPEVVKRCIL